MSRRYLLLTGDVDRVPTIVENCEHRFDLVVALGTPNAKLLADPELGILVFGGRAAILGTLHFVGRSGPVLELSSLEWYMITATRGRYLVERFWGDYIAIIFDQATNVVDVIRAPFGSLSCLFCTDGATTAIASDVALLASTGLWAPRLDRSALARHLLLVDIRRGDTALVGLEELRGGDRLTIGGSCGRTTLWSPWRFTSPDRQLCDSETAYAKLRDIAVHCVSEQTTTDDRYLLMMSGGLDSSIVAACLARAKRDVTGFTFFTENPTGDELEPARRVSRHLGFDLISDRCRVCDVDLARSAAGHLPRPATRGFEQGVRALVERAIQMTRATCVLNGGAGDNIFSTIVSPAPVADCLLVDGGRRHFWSTAATVAELGKASLATVAWRGWRRARSRRPYRREVDMSFLAPAIGNESEAALDHPWLHAPAGVPPGKSVHVALLAPVQGLVEDQDPILEMPSRSVLVAQPIVEACLAIPSWLWFDQSHNRAAARHAFSADLPEETIWRRSKGTPDSYLVELLDTYRPMIRAMLSDGVLAGLGLLDVRSVQAELDDPRPARGFVFARLMQLIDAEAWARCWPT